MKKLKKHDTIRVFEGFAGYGGATYGLNHAGIRHEVVGYSEFDKFASALYDANHKDKNGNPIKNWGDITKINPEDLPDFDLFTGGFPCQPFSQVGMQQGEKDRYGRGTLMYDILRICEVKKPKYILLENVKGLATKKFEKTFDTLKSELKRMGYGDLKYAILNSKDYGIPQNRERLWMFARLGGLPEDFSMIPPTVDNGLKLKDFVDKKPDESLYLSQEQIEKYDDYKVKQVQKIKNGYGFRVILKFEDGSSVVQQRAGFCSYKEADEERCVVITDLKRKSYLFNGSIPADEFFTYWIEEIYKKRAKKYSSYYNYRGIINNHIIPFFRKKRISAINTGDIVRLYMKTYKYSESVAENVRTIMKASLNDAVVRKAIATNVAKDVPLPKHKKVGYERKIDTSKTFTYEQVLALIDGSRGTPIHLMVLFNVIMGLRCSEIIGLKYSDVDFTNQTLSISRQLGIDIEKSREDLAPKTYTKQEILPKTYSSIRTINIPDIVYDAIIQERKTYDKNKRRRSTVFNDLGYICCSTYGRPRSKNFYYKHYKRLLESLDLPNIRWHDLRSTAATMLLKAGFKPKAVSEMMGHAKEIITVDVYGDKDKLVDIDLYELESFINDVRPKLEECISTEKYVIDTSEYLAN